MVVNRIESSFVEGGAQRRPVDAVDLQTSIKLDQAQQNEDKHTLARRDVADELHENQQQTHEAN